MATGTKNAKSVMTTIRIPHDQMEALKAAAQAERRSLANYLVTAGLTRIKAKEIAGLSSDMVPVAVASAQPAEAAEATLRNHIIND